MVQTQSGGILADSVFTKDGTKTLHLQLDKIEKPTFVNGGELTFSAEGALFQRTCKQLSVLVKELRKKVKSRDATLTSSLSSRTKESRRELKRRLTALGTCCFLFVVGRVIVSRYVFV